MNQRKKQKLSILGMEITDAQISAAHQVMLGIWHYKELKRALIAAGVPEYGANPHNRWARKYPVAMRAADRILQYERKAGRIAPIEGKRGYWGWTTTN